MTWLKAALRGLKVKPSRNKYLSATKTTLIRSEECLHGGEGLLGTLLVGVVAALFQDLQARVR
jgi:hypothetical protein